MQKKTWTLKTESEWQAVATDVLGACTHQRDLIFLEGPLGTGKTTFTRYCVEALGGKHVSSPTYALHHEYEVRAGVVDHLDLYRITSEEDWCNTGLPELFTKPRGLILVEWASKISSLNWPKNWNQIKIQIQLNKNGERAVVMDSPQS